MKILVFNVGSTTLKFACIDAQTGQRIHSGLVDRVGQPGGDAEDHVAAAMVALEKVGRENVDAIGHRMVQGGAEFREPTRVTAEVLDRLRPLDSLAPLHNPPARRVVEGLVELGIDQTLVFDTAYFASLPPEAYRYAIPEELYREHGIRRYGFHGTSHQYVTDKAIEFLGGDETSKIISLHLGGGASATASVGGVAIDTSMGMTPLEGLVMASRCGDLDPAIALHLIQHVGMSPAQVDQTFNKQSGLLGLCGESDMRAVLKRRDQGDSAAKLAIDIYVRKLVKTIGGYFAVLGGLDAILFTAGVGEHSHAIRQLVCDALPHLGIQLDATLNDGCSGAICDLATVDSPVRVLVVPTDEELAIAMQVQ